MRVLQSVVRLGSQVSKRGTRRYHPNSPGDLIKGDEGYQRVMRKQSYMLDQANVGTATHNNYGFRDSLFLSVGAIAVLMLASKVARDYTKAAKIKL